MDNKETVEEIDKQCMDQTTPTEKSDESCVQTTLEQLDGTVLNDTVSERDLHTIQNKRLELDNIQRDLDDLMGRLNSFIADSQENFLDDVSVDGISEAEEDILNVSEKQDGPPEKELNSYEATESLLNKIYVSDNSNPPEINWDMVGPILQKHVADLQRLHNLNQMTNAVVKRIRNVTQINEVLLKEASEKLHEGS
ncbi:hypothetical protein ILUMI_08765 [Ignelater luminosus]|uniref:Uncharacterized protein n=1 Tax=Ignelater luminosus TaxID=2038154 RepID=A0A8K0D5M8_IGNLU|nr:hypothetical protein ILUMI_08765 [Ignelater luminosus]